MLNALALAIGFLATLFIFVPQFSIERTQEVKGIKIEDKAVPFYPTPEEVQNQKSVLSEFDSNSEPTITPPPSLSEPEAPPTPTLIPTPTINEPSTGILNESEPGNFIITQINNYRIDNGLNPYETHPLVCSFAKERAAELKGNFTHSGFDGRLQSNNLPYPSYSNVAENIAFTSFYTKVFNMWRNSPRHNQNLLSNSPFACVAAKGNYFVFESWTP